MTTYVCANAVHRQSLCIRRRVLKKTSVSKVQPLVPVNLMRAQPKHLVTTVLLCVLLMKMVKPRTFFTDSSDEYEIKLDLDWQNKEMGNE